MKHIKRWLPIAMLIIIGAIGYIGFFKQYITEANLLKVLGELMVVCSIISMILGAISYHLSSRKSIKDVILMITLGTAILPGWLMAMAIGEQQGLLPNWWLAAGYGLIAVYLIYKYRRYLNKESISRVIRGIKGFLDEVNTWRN